MINPLDAAIRRDSGIMTAEKPLWHEIGLYGISSWKSLARESTDLYNSLVITTKYFRFDILC